MKNRWFFCALFVVALILSHTISQAAPVTATFTGTIASFWQVGADSDDIEYIESLVGDNITTTWVFDIDLFGEVYYVNSGSTASYADQTGVDYFFSELVSSLILGGQSDYLPSSHPSPLEFYYACNQTTSSQYFTAFAGLNYEAATLKGPNLYPTNWGVDQTTLLYTESILDSDGGSFGITGRVTLSSITEGTHTPIPSSALLLITGIIGILSKRRLN